MRLVARGVEVRGEARDHAAGAAVVAVRRTVVALEDARRRIARERLLEHADHVVAPLKREERIADELRVPRIIDKHRPPQVDLLLLPGVLDLVRILERRVVRIG
ncbi:MAG: hypothetical protein ACKO0W_08730, partial [Planctomycetota bacterium]